MKGKINNRKPFTNLQFCVIFLSIKEKGFRYLCFVSSIEIWE